MATDKTSIDKAEKAVVNRFDNVLNAMGVDTLEGDTYSIVLSRDEVSAGLGLLAETIFTPSNEFANFDSVQFQKLYSLFIHLMEATKLSVDSMQYPTNPMSCCDETYDPTKPVKPKYPIGTGQPDPIGSPIDNPNPTNPTSGTSVLTMCFAVRPPIYQSFGIWQLINRQSFRTGIDSAIAAAISEYEPANLISVTFVASGFGVTAVTAGIPVKFIGNLQITETAALETGEGGLLPEGQQVFAQSGASLPVKFTSQNIVRPFVESTGYGYLNIVPESIGTIPDLALTLLRLLANIPANISGDIWRGANEYQFGSTQYPISDNDITVSLAYPLDFFRLYLSCFSCYLTTRGFTMKPDTRNFYNVNNVQAQASDDVKWYSSVPVTAVENFDGKDSIKLLASPYGYTILFEPIDRVLPKGIKRTQNVTVSVDYNCGGGQYVAFNVRALLRYNSPNYDNFELTLNTPIVGDNTWHTAELSISWNDILPTGKDETAVGDTIALTLTGPTQNTDGHIANIVLTLDSGS